MTFRYVLLNTRTLYPVNQLFGDPVADGAKQKAITVRAEDQGEAALKILEEHGFTLEPCCLRSEDYLCDECRLDDEEQTAAGRL